MTRIAGRTVFRRSPEDVFDFLVDPRHEPSYNRRVVTARKVTPGRIRPGTRFVQQVRSFGRLGEATIDLVSRDRPRHLAWHIRSRGMDVTGEQTLTAEAGGTRVDWVWNFATRGALRLLGPLVGLAGRRLERQVWANMKEALDRSAPSESRGRGRTAPPAAVDGG